jgi:hypothetical protein
MSCRKSELRIANGEERPSFVVRCFPFGRSPLAIRCLHFATACSLISALATGCRKTETRFDILSFKDPGAPEKLTERFDAGSFAVNARDNWDIVFEIPPTRQAIDAPSAPAVDPTSAPADDGSQELATDDIWVSQLLHISMFWRPRPGTTLAESTQTNATLRYALITGGSAIVYEGAGFVFFKQSRDGQTLHGKLESSTVAPAARFVDDRADLLGRCQIQGTFTAHRDRQHVVSVLQQLRKQTRPPGARASH